MQRLNRIILLLVFMLAVYAVTIGTLLLMAGLIHDGGTTLVHSQHNSTNTDDIED